MTAPRMHDGRPASRRSQTRAHDEHTRLAQENAQLAQDNEDLRESARIWIWLYEQQLERANKAIAELEALAAARKDPA